MTSRAEGVAPARRPLARKRRSPPATIRSLVAEVEALQAKAVRLRADVMVRDTALMWERERQAVLAAAHPGLARRIELARRVEALTARVHELTRSRPLERQAASEVRDHCGRTCGTCMPLERSDAVRVGRIPVAPMSPGDARTVSEGVDGA